MGKRFNRLVIVGGGSAGWMTAALLAKVTAGQYHITVIESEAIGTVGVGEATIPPIQLFNQLLGIDEATFIKQTQATIKLGIQFENWNKNGDCYMHAFGNIGRDLGFTHFHHYWLRAHKKGLTNNFWDYSFNYQAAKRNLFSKMDRIPNSPLQGLVYAYHFDAALYAKFLRQLSEANGVKRIEGKVCDVTQDGESGYIDALHLESGEAIKGDLFIDCSGFKGLLIEQVLNTGYENWSDWLFCDRAVAVPSEKTSPVTPYTRAIAHNEGWQWRIPLQHRTGHGLVFSSDHLSTDEACHRLLTHLDGDALADPKVIPFTTGRRKKQWNKNVVAIGLSSGFLEPLESTSLHLIQQGITRLIKHLPSNGICNAEVDEYNRQSQYEFEKIRDFIILHYYLNEKLHLNQKNSVNSHQTNQSIWQKSRHMPIPQSLKQKIELFKHTGKLFREQDELFSEVAWHQVLMGQGVIPSSYHPLANMISDEQLTEFLNNLKVIINSGLDKLSSHKTFLDSFDKLTI